MGVTINNHYCNSNNSLTVSLLFNALWHLNMEIHEHKTTITTKFTNEVNHITAQRMSTTLEPVRNVLQILVFTELPKLSFNL